MTETEFIDELFGAGWTHDQLPVFLAMVKAYKENSERYLELRDRSGEGWVTSRPEMRAFDDEVDAQMYGE